ncbi:MAG: M14 family metallopeptidase [Parvularculaceae bacterium]
MSGPSDVMRLSIFDTPPYGLEDVSAINLGTILDGPSLIHLRGEQTPPLVVSVLLHGNETTSWDVARALIARARGRPLARAIMLFVGNIPASAAGKRYLPGQPDFNRIWSGGDQPIHALAAETLGIFRSVGPFAVIDIHNNTGRNPLYSCVSRLEPQHLHLASLFSDLAVYYTNPPSALSVACSAFAPSIAVECGRSGDPAGYETALELVEKSLRIDALRQDFQAVRALKLYHTLGRIMLEDGSTFSFDGADADIMIEPGIETWNFRPIGTEAVWARSGKRKSPLRVIGEDGSDMTDKFFRQEAGETRLIAPATPSMLSTDRDNARLDCLGYLMEGITLGAEG